MKIGSSAEGMVVQSPYFAVAGGIDFAAMLASEGRFGADRAVSFSELGMFGRHGAVPSGHERSAMSATPGPVHRLKLGEASREREDFTPRSSGPQSDRRIFGAAGTGGVAIENREVGQTQVRLDGANPAVATVEAALAEDGADRASAREETSNPAPISKSYTEAEGATLGVHVDEEPGGLCISVYADRIPLLAADLLRLARTTATEFGLSIETLRVNGIDVTGRFDPHPTSRGGSDGHRGN